MTWKHLSISHRSDVIHPIPSHTHHFIYLQHGERKKKKKNCNVCMYTSRRSCRVESNRLLCRSDAALSLHIFFPPPSFGPQHTSNLHAPNCVVDAAFNWKKSQWGVTYAESLWEILAVKRPPLSLSLSLLLTHWLVLSTKAFQLFFHLLLEKLTQIILKCKSSPQYVIPLLSLCLTWALIWPCHISLLTSRSHGT